MLNIDQQGYAGAIFCRHCDTRKTLVRSGRLCAICDSPQLDGKVVRATWVPAGE